MEDVEVALGRSRGQHVAQSIRLAALCRASGVRVKLNTVVTTLNAEEDLSGLVRQIAPERWKVFQVLPMLGQNDGAVEPLLISAEAFDGFVLRHEPLRTERLAPVVEDNDTMRGSYAMIDPRRALLRERDRGPRLQRPHRDAWCGRDAGAGGVCAA
jgi:radical S-adenosyl methionine domain-containing protein 2